MLTGLYNLNGKDLIMDFKTDENRIYLENEKGKVIAEISFPKVADGVYAITHTFVDPSLRGQGVADKLTMKAYNVIKERNCKLQPQCTYAEKWFNENPDKSDVLAE